MSEYFEVGAIESKFGLTLPPRYRHFLSSEREAADGKVAELPTYGEPMELWFDGPELESFINDDWPDFDDDGNPYGHPSATEIDFDDDFAGWVPLATIGSEESQVLLCKVSDPACPVAMWEHETGEPTPVSESLDAFLATLADE